MAITSSKAVVRRSVTRAHGRINPKLREDLRDQIAHTEASRRSFQLQLDGHRSTRHKPAVLQDKIKGCTRTLAHLRSKLADLH